MSDSDFYYQQGYEDAMRKMKVSPDAREPSERQLYEHERRAREAGACSHWWDRPSACGQCKFCVEFGAAAGATPADGPTWEVTFRGVGNFAISGEGRTVYAQRRDDAEWLRDRLSRGAAPASPAVREAAERVIHWWSTPGPGTHGAFHQALQDLEAALSATTPTEKNNERD